jgi:hypothetical protein
MFVNNPWQPFVDGHLNIGDPFLPKLPETILASGDYVKGSSLQNSISARKLFG